MTLLRSLAVGVLLLASASGALAAPEGAMVAPDAVPLGIKVCLVGAALGAAVERLASGRAPAKAGRK